MIEQLQSRLVLLKQEFETGQRKLQELERQETYLRETLLRISGAIQVIEELLAGQDPNQTTMPVTDGKVAERTQG